MKDIVGYIVAALVDNSEQVAIEEVTGNQASVLELKVAKDDLGKIIGKKGRTVQAIRIILNASSAKTKKRTILEIIE
ncbi:MAG: KH domain-containing protein [Desulfobacterales bacterium]